MALARPDVEKDRYTGSLRMIAEGGVARDFTLGPRDSGPVLSPDGHTLVFLRAPETGPPQLYRIDLGGGEAQQLTSHVLGATAPVFSPDGDRIAYLAPAPEQGRYGTDPDIKPEAEPPRPIGRMSYRRDGKGFLLDRPDQVFVNRPEFRHATGSADRRTGHRGRSGVPAGRPHRLCPVHDSRPPPRRNRDDRRGRLRGTRHREPACRTAR